jgi:transposase
MSQSSLLKSALQELRDRPDQLIEIILRQAEQIELMRKEIDELKKQIRDLNDRNNGLSSKVEQLEKAAARQAAPFRIDTQRRVLNPKRPGRRAGHPGSCRKVPDHIDEEIWVPLAACPHCGQNPGPRRAVVQYIEELPPVRPRVIKLVTQEAQCMHCQQVVRSSHPLQVSLAQGAAGVQLGPRALGVAAELNKKHGLTMRKTCAVLHQLFGLSLTAGGLSHALARLAGKLKPACENLLARLRDGPVLHSDETSWWVGGPGYWLWVFADKNTTVYRVADGRGRNIIAEMLGDKFTGVLVSDCLAIYDDVNAHQQKCYSHHLKALATALEEEPGDYLQEVKGLLKAALALKKACLEASEFAPLRAALEDTAQRLLTAPQTGLAEKVRRRLYKQRDHLFTFLDHSEVEATNNLAERQLRPAVIARKISCGNKTLRGARTWETLTSLAATCAQRGESFAQRVAEAALLSYAR